jgi:hypothetical protein
MVFTIFFCDDHLRETSSHFLESSSHLVESSNHLAESSTYLVEIQQHKSMNNIKNILCNYLILKVEKTFCFATATESISAPSNYFWGTYGQSIKLAKKPRTLVLRIIATIEN